MQHVFIVGAKSIGAYGGYETFVYKLIEAFRDSNDIKFHIACKANGDGYMDETKCTEVTRINDREFEMFGAHCFKISVPNWGAATALYYDVASLKYCYKYILDNHIEKPIIYILACRIGPYLPVYYKKIKRIGGKIFVNPDGHEWLRAKWSAPVKRYWKLSERLMINNCDIAICDSTNIEKYIHEQYDKKNKKVNTKYIAYGADIDKSILEDDDTTYIDWLSQNGLEPKKYYLIVGRFVPENNYETMIREFMAAKTEKSLAIITGSNSKLMKQLENKLNMNEDHRIKFCGTVYNQELLKKIRENAYAYLHGHEVGGTNPSLLEALGSTDLNLLLDVGFNREVAEKGGLYWDKKENTLRDLIHYCEQMENGEILELSNKAKERIRENYTWQKIAGEYKKVFV